MEKKDLYTLEILNKIEGDEKITQRDIALSLGMSLGIVNAFIKRIAKKGYIKITTIPSNRVKYLLTTKGMKEKASLTLKYLQYSMDFYKTVKNAVIESFKGLEEIKAKQIIFYGAGEVAEIAYTYLTNTDLVLVGIVDDKKAGHVFFRYQIIDKERLKKIEYDKILITSFHSALQIKKNIKGLGIEEDKILLLHK
ncbi:MAG: winged helix-turn-helix transcriptional regulator [bacterium]